MRPSASLELVVTRMRPTSATKDALFGREISVQLQARKIARTIAKLARLTCSRKIEQAR